MIKRNISVVSAVVLAICSFTTVVYGFGEPIKGKPLTEEEAKAKYPPPKGGYPRATLGSSGSVIVPSPYNSGRMIDTSDCKRGMPCLDPMANKVFLKP